MNIRKDSLIFIQRILMSTPLQNLILAEKKASQLFEEIERRNLIAVGKTEKELNTDVMELAFELFGIRKYCHKRIVRSGKNTLEPYHGNPPNLPIQEDDILWGEFLRNVSEDDQKHFRKEAADFPSAATGTWRRRGQGLVRARNGPL